MGNKRANATLSADEDWLICEVRRLTWLPLDDLWLLLSPMFPKLSRSALHRCLQYYGISKKPKELSDKPKRSKFKSYEIARYKPNTGNLIFHSDQGTQYSSKVLIDYCNKIKITQSMSRKGNCWDNTPLRGY